MNRYSIERFNICFNIFHIDVFYIFIDLWYMEKFDRYVHNLTFYFNVKRTLSSECPLKKLSLGKSYMFARASFFCICFLTLLA